MRTEIKLAAIVAALGLIYACNNTKEKANSDDPEELAATTLSFELQVHNGMTKSSFRIKEGGTLKIKNKSPDKDLWIESLDEPPPFDDVPGSSTPQSKFKVGPNSTEKVTIAADYVDGMQFTYTSQIGDSIKEDPIVIIER